jgi:hypothetical protein
MTDQRPELEPGVHIVNREPHYSSAWLDEPQARAALETARRARERIDAQLTLDETEEES